MEKISVLILVLLTNFLFCHPYVTMPNVSLNLVKIRPTTCMKGFEIFTILVITTASEVLPPRSWE